MSTTPKKPSGIALALLAIFAPSLQAAESVELEKLMEEQFAKDPKLGEAMIRGGEAFIKPLDDLAARTSSALVKAAVDGFKDGLDFEAQAHGIVITP